MELPTTRSPLEPGCLVDPALSNLHVPRSIEALPTPNMGGSAHAAMRVVSADHLRIATFILTQTQPRGTCSLTPPPPLEGLVTAPCPTQRFIIRTTSSVAAVLQAGTCWT